MNRQDRDRLLRRAMERAAGRDAFVAGALAEYGALHQMGEAALAEYLHCPPESLPRLALCRRPPDADPARFRAGVQRIAAYAGADPARLAGLLREVEAARALRQSGRAAADADAGMLMAARDAGISEDRPRPAGVEPPAADEEPEDE